MYLAHEPGGATLQKAAKLRSAQREQLSGKYITKGAILCQDHQTVLYSVKQN